MVVPVVNGASLTDKKNKGKHWKFWCPNCALNQNSKSPKAILLSIYFFQWNEKWPAHLTFLLLLSHMFPCCLITPSPAKPCLEWALYSRWPQVIMQITGSSLDAHFPAFQPLMVITSPFRTNYIRQPRFPRPWFCFPDPLLASQSELTRIQQQSPL